MSSLTAAAKGSQPLHMATRLDGKGLWNVGPVSTLKMWRSALRMDVTCKIIQGNSVDWELSGQLDVK